MRPWSRPPTRTTPSPPPAAGRDTRNEDDPIAGDPQAAGNLLATSLAGDGTLGLVVLGVDPDA